MPPRIKRSKKQQINSQIQKVEKFIDYSSLLEDHNSVDFFEFYQNYMINSKISLNTNNSKRSKHESTKINFRPINSIDNGNSNDNRLLKLLETEGLIVKQDKKKNVRFTLDEDFILYKCSREELG